MSATPTTLSFLTAAVLCRTPALAPPQAQEAGELSLEPLVLESASGSRFDAEEGRLTVPENRARSDGGLVTLAFVYVHSRAENPGPPTIFLQGGPGQPATPIPKDPQQLASWEAILEQGDLVFLDQRGVGESRPNLELASDPDTKLPREFFADLGLARRLVRENQQRLRAHFESQGLDLSAYDTESSADDVDDLRAALGAEQINLIGFSYGTLLGLTTIRRHASHVSRVVLVGTEGPRDWGSLPTTLQGQIEKLALLASKDEGVNHAVPDLRSLLERVLAKVEAEPLPVEITDQTTGERISLLLGRWGLEFLLRIDVGDGNDFPLFPALLWTIDQGRSDVVSAILEKRYNQLGARSSAMAQAVRYAYGPTPVQEAAFAVESEACLFRSMSNYFDLDDRDVWNVPLHDETFRTPIVTSVPTLFVSGTLDSNAPPYQAEFVRWGFLDSVHLVVENAGHEDMLPNEEVRAIIARFLRGEDVRDARVSLPTPSFVGIRRKS